MQVHYGEGVAIHTGPEPCVGIREGVGEASAGWVMTSDEIGAALREAERGVEIYD